MFFSCIYCIINFGNHFQDMTLKPIENHLNIIFKEMSL